MGGLRKKETTNQVSQIPLLGDLPLIGILFRNTKEIVKNSELLVFLSPHIYKGEPLSEEQKAKFEEFREQPALSLPTDRDKDNQFHNADKQPQKK
jgi:type II secretory pathway component GspD/PulD (secretin)